VRFFTDLIIFTDIYINVLSIYADTLLKVSWKENIIITHKAQAVNSVCSFVNLLCIQMNDAQFGHLLY